jgi:hypothetical protein
MADETLARMFWGRMASDADRPAQMIKEKGRRQTLAWSQVGETVRELALGLLALGRRPGEAVALLSQSRAEAGRLHRQRLRGSDTDRRGRGAARESARGARPDARIRREKYHALLESLHV